MAMNEEFNEAMHEGTKEFLERRKPGYKTEFPGKSLDDNTSTESKPKTIGKELTGKEL